MITGRYEPLTLIESCVNVRTDLLGHSFKKRKGSGPRCIHCGYAKTSILGEGDGAHSISTIIGKSCSTLIAESESHTWFINRADSGRKTTLYECERCGTRGFHNGVLVAPHNCGIQRCNDVLMRMVLSP